jgi:hypothetical protein
VIDGNTVDDIIRYDMTAKTAGDASAIIRVAGFSADVAKCRRGRTVGEALRGSASGGRTGDRGGDGGFSRS